MEEEWRSAIIIGVFFTLSLIGAVVLFSYLESYAEVLNPVYRLGGGIAGFFVIFVLLFTAYSKLIGKPPSETMKEATRAITKPKGFHQYKSLERGFVICYPKKWKVVEETYFPPILFSADKQTSVNLVTGKVGAKFLRDIENDPSALSHYYLKIRGELFKEEEILYEDTIALRGVQCPMYTFEKKMGERILRQTQVAYLDIKGKKIHWITCTTSVAEFEDLKPIFKKILSTFQTI